MAEKKFLIIKDNKVVNVTIGTTLKEVKEHFPDFNVDEFIDIETVHSKYGVSLYYPEYSVNVPITEE